MPLLEETFEAQFAMNKLIQEMKRTVLAIVEGEDEHIWYHVRRRMSRQQTKRSGYSTHVGVKTPNIILCHCCADNDIVHIGWFAHQTHALL